MPMGQVMFGRYVLVLPLVFSACASAQVGVPAPPSSEWATQCEDWDEWDKPGPPFRIHGNSYYVGTCGIGAILIASDDGHFLIDSGTEAGADVVLANIRALGFDPADISLLLTSHEHFDHVGGMAKLQAATGADVLTSEAAQSVLRTGVANPADPQFGMSEAMAPVPVVETYGLGNHYGYILDGLGVSMIQTPGHTPGALSWQWQSCDDVGDCRTIVYADSMTPVSNDSYRFSDHPEYVAAFRAGIARVVALDCDILLTPHPSASDMRDKLLGDGLASGTNCRDYAASITRRLDARLAEEAAL
jgi:metallo-beta-lactamase class B